VFSCLRGSGEQQRVQLKPDTGIDLRFVDEWTGCRDEALKKLA